MSFFNFLRRVNRGIVLAIVLIIGLSCYLTVDAMAFKDERESIKQTLEKYTTDMESFVLLPEQYREMGVEVPDSVIEDKINENNALLDKYFITTNNYGWDIKKSMASDLESILKKNNKTGNKIKSNEAKLTEVNSITKHGSNLVTVEAVINLTATATPEAENFHVFGMGSSYYYDYPNESPEMAFTTGTVEISFTCEMVKRDGVWMFSNNEGMSTMSW